MKNVILYLLAINIFLCYGGICDLCHDVISQGNSESTCHSMGGMEHETVKADTGIAKDKILVSTSDNNSLCQYFLVTKSFKVSNDIYDGIALVNPDYTKQDNYKYIFDKSTFNIPDKGNFPKLFLKHSSFII
jgi:hypothetical protein